MRKAIVCTFVIAAMLTACTKEAANGVSQSEESLEEVNYVDVTFGAEFALPLDEDGAKTMLDDDLSVLWSEGDKIAVNYNSGSGLVMEDLNVFTAEIDPKDYHKATFSGKIREGATKFFAIYPSDNVEVGKTLGVPNGNMYAVLPNSQTATEGSFTNGCALSCGYGDSNGGYIQDNVKFQNLCALLEFTMPDYVIGAQTVNIKSNDGLLMSGGCVIDRKDLKFNSFSPSDEKKPTYNNVTVTAPNTASKFYAVIFPGNYANGFAITVTTANGQVYSRNVTKALNAKANRIYNLGTLGVVLDEGKVDLAVNIEQNIKTGSIATFSIVAKGDFEKMVKSWDINLYNSKDQLVRKIEGNTTGSGTLETVGDFKLLAAGDYYAKVSYFMQTGSKREAFKIEGITAPQFKVEGVVVNATTALNYNGGVLSGTDVQLSFDTSAVDPEIAALINWTEVTLKDANDVTYRTATEAGKMTPASGKPYLPNGKYTLAAYFTLPALGSNTPTALDPKTITVSLTPTFGVTLTSAKTSYDYYKAGSVDTANGCNNMGVYELAANVTGISDAVATQMAGKFTYEWFLDGNSIGATDSNVSVSGISKNTDGAVKVAFGNKNVNCKATFQGGNATSENKAVDITGLPYGYTFENDKGKAESEGWTLIGDISTSAYQLYIDCSKNSDGSIRRAFHIPEDINVKSSFNLKKYGTTSWGKVMTYVETVSTSATSSNANGVENSLKNSLGNTKDTVTQETELKFSSSTPCIILRAKRTEVGTASSVRTYTNSCTIIYR